MSASTMATEERVNTQVRYLLAFATGRVGEV